MAGMTALKRYRKAHKLTLDEMGRELGVTGQTVWRYENGRRMPRPRELPIISEKTGIPIADLVPQDDSCGAAA
jgi:transcriptional regulator with XRE-family HTH domain